MLKKIATEKEKATQEIKNLGNRIERTQAKIDAIQEEHGSNFESETKLHELQQQKKIFKQILKTRKKRSPLLKNKQKP